MRPTDLKMCMGTLGCDILILTLNYRVEQVSIYDLRVPYVTDMIINSFGPKDT